MDALGGGPSDPSQPVAAAPQGPVSAIIGQQQPALSAQQLQAQEEEEQKKREEAIVVAANQE